MAIASLRKEAVAFLSDCLFANLQLYHENRAYQTIAESSAQDRKPLCVILAAVVAGIALAFFIGGMVGGIFFGIDLLTGVALVVYTYTKRFVDLVKEVGAPFPAFDRPVNGVNPRHHIPSAALMAGDRKPLWIGGAMIIAGTALSFFVGGMPGGILLVTNLFTGTAIPVCSYTKKFLDLAQARNPALAGLMAGMPPEPFHPPAAN